MLIVAGSNCNAAIINHLQTSCLNFHVSCCFNVYENENQYLNEFFNSFSAQSVKTIFLKLRTFPFIFIPLHIFYSASLLLYEYSLPDSPNPPPPPKKFFFSEFPPVILTLG